MAKFEEESVLEEKDVFAEERKRRNDLVKELWAKCSICEVCKLKNQSVKHSYVPSYGKLSDELPEIENVPHGACIAIAALKERVVLLESADDHRFRQSRMTPAYRAKRWVKNLRRAVRDRLFHLVSIVGGE